MDKVCVIEQEFGGYGDIFFCQKIAAVMNNRGYKVLWPLREDLLWIKDYLISTAEFASRSEIGSLSGVAHLPLSVADRYYPGESVLKAKYKLANIDWNDWSDYFQFKRNHEKEQLLFDSLGLKEGDDYTVVCKKVGTPPNYREQEVYFDKDKKKIEIQFIDGFNCLDWCKVLECASEISVVDSVWCYICEKLDLKAELYLTSRFDPPNWMHIDGLFTKPWKRI